MPVAATYPGVYVEEILSGNNPLTGVGTSITAFIGHALRGPVNEPVRLTQFADFEQIFGGLWSDSTLGYAVEQFFLNGGTDACVIRIAVISLPPADGDAVKASHSFTVPSNDPLTIVASSEGTWGNNVFVKINANPDNTFNLIVREHAGPLVADQVLREEVHYNLTLSSSSERYIVGVMEYESDLIRVFPPVAGHQWTQPPSAVSETALTGGANGDFGTDADFVGSQLGKTGLYALETIDQFNILCIPPIRRTTPASAGQDVDVSTWATALAYCKQRRAILIIDPPETWSSAATAISETASTFSPLRSENAVLYFPRLIMEDELGGNALTPFVACGAIAGIIARTDASRGVWKAPAGTDAQVAGAWDLTVNLTNTDSGQLNPLAINTIRRMPAAGIVVWGARTLVGADQLASQWKFLPVRRLALYLEESLIRGTQWAVFEPNDESLWAQLRLLIGGFMHDLYRRHAFAGKSPQEAYFVICDSSTTPQEDIDRGIVNVVIGFAPLKPAEFVIVKIQQIAGQTAN